MTITPALQNVSQSKTEKQIERSDDSVALTALSSDKSMSEEGGEETTVESPNLLESLMTKG